MKTTMSRVVASLTLSLGVFALSAFAQIASPDGSLWNVVTNNVPGGGRAVPVVSYNPATGMMSLDTRGLNGAVDTVGNGTIASDDVGMISLIVPGPDGATQAPFTGLDLTQFISWSNAYFAGKEQIIGNGLTPANQFLVPGVYPVIQYAAGLSAADFGPVEMAVNFTAGAPGAVLNGRVQVVPEPATFGLIGTALIAGLGFIRRR